MTAVVATAVLVHAGTGIAAAHTGTTDPFGSGSVFANIGAGSTATDIGDVWFNRAATATGETLSLHAHVPGGITDSHLCLSSSAFISRIAPGQCAYPLGADADGIADHVINLGTTYVGLPLFAQYHVVSQGETAYAGNTPAIRGAFFGNVILGSLGGGDDDPGGSDIVCDEGQHGVDTDADTFTDTCVEDENNGGGGGGEDIVCAEGQHGIDTDADTFTDTCVEDENNGGGGGGGEDIVCAEGQHGIDTDADTFTDTCVEDDPGDVVLHDVVCATGMHGVDTNADGVLDTCVADVVLDSNQGNGGNGGSHDTVLGAIFTAGAVSSAAVGSGALARTGLDVVDLLGAGLVLIMLGFALLGTDARRRRPVTIG